MPQGLYLPPRYVREYLDRQSSFRADVLRSVDLTDSDPLLNEMTARLQAFDRRLMLVRAAAAVAPGVPMKPGYYHLLIDNGPGVPLTVTVIEGENGEFCEPTSRLFEKLMSGDLREERNRVRMRDHQALTYARNEVELADSNAERREHLKDLINAYTRTGVSMTTARPWTQNTQPQARAAAGQVVRLDEYRRKGAA